MALRTPTLIALSAVTLLSGCSAFRNYDSELAQTNQQLATGNVDAALTLLQETGIPQAKEYAGFPVGGQFLVCENPEVVNHHLAKVYGQAEVGAHIDIVDPVRLQQCLLQCGHHAAG